ncbi:uncharacterized protein LOC112603764 [Melanaphis sacchari]|uniref:uncharacterized protein LOC112603764 n=1 Tax=Melanaphis sacchari TaxID=742174 RepID=UPI000DC14578|nr:uncharacterized protein LOC112603764 [Melanaphis sacchari]
MKLYIIAILMVEIVVGTSVFNNEYYMNKIEQFCGQRLINELNILCMSRYTETTASKSQRPEKRIVDVCCSKPCSRNYMKTNFCLPETEESIIIDSPIVSPIEEVDYIGYYFELLGRVLEPNNKD